MREILSEIALASAIFFFCLPAAGQDIGNIVEQMVEEGASAEEVEEYLQQLSEGRRLNLNTATREQLEKSGLFTPFQTASLLDYRRDYGALLTLQELSLIDGFGAAEAARLAPLVTLSDDASGGLSLQVRSRYRYKSDVEGVHQYNRVQAARGGFKAGLLAESDPGEMPLIDHIGAYAGWAKGCWSVLAGDYSACFGQGLALWNSFAFISATSPASLMRRSKGVVPYKSADENMGLHGVAVHYDGAVKATLFASAAGVDARVGESGYTSLPTSGYHRTAAEKAVKDAMREYLAGGNVSLRGECFEAGVTAVAYTFSEHNARRVMAYNRYQMYDGWHGNLSADVSASAGHWRLFAEGAIDAGAHCAAIAGAVFTPSYGFEAALSLRWYDKGYIAPHAGAYSTISSVSNQAGAVLSLLWRPVRGVTLTSFTEAVHYPWARYRVDGPSSAFYEKVRAEYTSGELTFALQDNYVWQSAGDSHKHSLKATAKGEWGRWKVALRGAAVLQDASRGMAVSASAQREFGRRRHCVAASLTWYSTDGYDTRVYLYEADLPGSFSAQYHYGKGIAARCLTKVKPARNLTLTGVVAVSGALECRLQADYDF